MTYDGRKTREALNTDAARWVVELAADSCDDSVRRSFEAWRSSSPAHEVAFEREQLAWERTERLRALRTVEHPAAGVQSHSPGGSLRRWRTFSVAASVIAAAAFAVLVWVNAQTEVYETAVGERRSIRLEDGSSLDLNTDTRVAVRMGKGERRLELLRGESMFDVQQDAARPFVVVLGESSVKAIGTAFSIRRDSDNYTVLVTEGVVEVAAKTSGSAEAYQLRLPAGSTATYDLHGLESHVVTQAERERALSWRNGTISLAGESLAVAVAEFNRYNTRRIVIADPSIAGLQLGGYFDAHDLDGFVEVLEAAFAVEVSTAGDDIYLKGRTQAAGAPDQGR